MFCDIIMKPKYYGRKYNQYARCFLVFLMHMCYFSLWICETRGHVALTFPPARKFDLDFLDNSRTKAPCGMPKGTIKTSLLEGSRFNVTWHLGYPHKGGFKIHLLDFMERPLLDLTPTSQGSEFVSNDATAQAYHVKLPGNFTCHNCTLRLLRQALEWGPNYKFWSCADIDILPRKSFRETCSGHGRNLVGRCKCERLYYGDICQYRDECIEDSDCGDHGKCYDIEATTAPKKQCYCQTGWFGPGCNKRSPVRTTTIDFDLYKEKKLSDTFMLYWRVLKEQKELEVVMVANGTSYVGLGWRPKNLTKSCKNIFSHPNYASSNSQPNISVEPEPKGEPQSNSEPEPEPSAISEPEPSAISEPEPSAISEPEPSAISEPEPIAISEPEPTSIAEPEPTTAPKDIFERRKRADTLLFDASSKGTETPEPEATAEPSSKSVPEPEATAEPSSKSVPEPEPESEPEPKPEPNKFKSNEKSQDEYLDPYTPRHDFSPMDCTDMIIGSARGNTVRIGDYYTRDRSTPRMDNFWGGKNDLTAAMGFEKDGQTTILFRKKLLSKEPTDHSIEEGLMHVIFAQGQEKGKYIHVPKSGVDTETASVKDFYKPDELKYHGHGKQRGVVSLNFLEEANIVGSADETASNETTLNTDCSGQWKVPKNCNPDNYTCEYSVKWEMLPRVDSIRFSITTKHTDTWTGIGFSDDEKMSQTDAILGWVDTTSRVFMMDTWISGYTQPLLDSSQNIFNISGRIVDGVTTLFFSRKRNTQDPKDLAFTDDHCLYMMYPVRGGAFNSVNKKIRKHEVVPVVSTNRICIKSCGNDEFDDYATTTEAPGLGYKVELKLVDLGENFEIPSKGSIQYDTLSNSITDNFKPVFEKLPGYRRIVVDNIKGEERNVIARINLQLDMPKDQKTGSSGEELDETNQKVHNILQKSIQTGRVGNLKVDPQYLVFEPQALNINVISDESSESNGQFWSLEGTRLYIVLACLAALICVTVLQAICAIQRAISRSKTKHKDHLISKSPWKEFSANTNYAFEAFETKDKQPPVSENKKKYNYQDIQEISDQKSSANINSRIQMPKTRPPNFQPGNYPGDTRSLQRPKEYLPANIDRTFSLPRSPYDRNQSGGAPELQPDFYFMPSQRKYSGEVVRVFVDYNNANKK